MRVIKTCLLVAILCIVTAHGVVRIWQAYHSLPSAILNLKGYVEELPTQQGLATHFLFHSDLGLINLSWYQHAPPIKPGQYWQLLVKIHPPQSLHNFKQPSSLYGLRQQGVRATGYVKSGKLIKAQCYLVPIQCLRWHIKTWLIDHLSLSQVKGMLVALVLGDKSLIDQDAWLVFQRTGTSHLVAISGLHIGLVAAGAGFLARCLWAAVPFLALRFAAQRAGWLAALLAAILYSALAGFAVPTQRAVIMIAILSFGKIFNRNVSPFYAWAWAALLVGLWNPWSLFMPGTWLSFAAVGSLLYVFCHRLGKGTAFYALMKPQWTVAMVLLPLVFLFFQQINFIDIAVNTIAIPTVSFIVVPSLLLACLLSPIASVSQGLLWVAEHSANLLWAGLSYAAKLPYWGMYLPRPEVLAVVLAVLGMLFLLAPSATPGRILGVVFCLPLYFWMPKAPKMGTAEVFVLDVGQGLSVLVKTHSHLLVYDTGPHYPFGFDAGQRVVLPAVVNTGANHIDKLVISHADNDHAGGANYLLNNIKVDELDTSAKKKFSAYNPRDCVGTWQWDGVVFTFFEVSKKQGRNNHSCIVKVSAGNRVLLLPGDIEHSAESQLLKEGAGLHADVLLAPHHGSKTSSTQAFIESVDPTYVVFSTGLNNRFHLPNLTVVDRYKKQGATLYNTAEVGALSFILGGNLNSPKTALEDW